MIAHNFHIPVMGIGYTIDTPIKVAQYGISSVISLVDNMLIEKMRENYCEKFGESFTAVGDDENDFHAKRITLYLNLVNKIVKKKFKELKSSFFTKDSEIIKYLEMLPDNSKIKQVYNKMLQTSDKSVIKDTQEWLKNNLIQGNIDVNIMTKLDKANFDGDNKLASQYNDAHSALRGFALSDLTDSSIVLSAGINPRLYSYISSFDDFYPDENGYLKKKIILKVSDYRSALTQGKFLAKKGLWVSEYRVESGLNCGGHAFATEGHLLGPILEEFKNNKTEFVQLAHNIFIKALKKQDRKIPDTPFGINITVQGGIGTADENEFLLNYFKVVSTGWGTPFLLVPEVTNVDDATCKLLAEAKEKDFYVSDISPLGVSFNSVKGNTKDKERKMFIEKGTPGSVCHKKILTGNTDFTKRPICVASRQYQSFKLKELDQKNLEPAEYKKEYDKIVEKTCLCTGLGATALMVNNIDTSLTGKGVSVCPGPNMAYFSKIVSLKEMVDHIYGRIDLLCGDNFRPNMFIKELDMYVDYFKETVGEAIRPFKKVQIKYFQSFKNNIQDGINYYKELFSNVINESISIKDKLIEELDRQEKNLLCIQI